jgi:hypothetical protein
MLCGKFKTKKILIKRKFLTNLFIDVEKFRDYIKAEVLATDLVLADRVDGEKVELEDEVAVRIEVSVN